MDDCEFGWNEDEGAHDCILDLGHDDWHECFCGAVRRPARPTMELHEAVEWIEQLARDLMDQAVEPQVRDTIWVKTQAAIEKLREE